MIELFEPKLSKSYSTVVSNAMIKLLNKILMSNDSIAFSSNNMPSKEKNVLQEINCYFQNTKKSFICTIKELKENILVHFQLPGDTILNEEEYNICQSITENLSSTNIVLVVDNECGTYTLGKVDINENVKIIEPKTIKQNNSDIKSENEGEKEMSDITENITTETTSSTKTAESSNNETKAVSHITSDTGVWKEITARMKELNLPFKIVNRIRVQKNNFVKKYKDDYEKYIKDYAETQFEMFKNSQN